MHKHRCLHVFQWYLDTMIPFEFPAKNSSSFISFDDRIYCWFSTSSSMLIVKFSLRLTNDKTSKKYSSLFSCEKWRINWLIQMSNITRCDLYFPRERLCFMLKFFSCDSECHSFSFVSNVCGETNAWYDLRPSERDSSFLFRFSFDYFLQISKWNIFEMDDKEESDTVTMIIFDRSPLDEDSQRRETRNDLIFLLIAYLVSVLVFLDINYCFRLFR